MRRVEIWVYAVSSTARLPVRVSARGIEVGNVSDSQWRGPIPGWGPIPDGHEGIYIPDPEETLQQVRRAGEQLTETWVDQVRAALTAAEAGEQRSEVGEQP